MNRPSTILGAVEGYRLWSQSYDRAPNPLLALEERLLAPVIRDFVPARRVLDVGCGTGRWLLRLQKYGAACVVGLDLSPEMLAQAHSKDFGAGLICARADRLPIRSGSADVILCSFTLGYVRDLSGLARELARVASPGAMLFLSDFHPEASARGWRRSFRKGTEEIEVENFVHPIAEVEAAFHSAGFSTCDRMEAPLGGPERAIFASAGREDLFAAAVAAGPAIFVGRLRKKRAAAVRVQTADGIVLAGARVAFDARTALPADLAIRAGRVQSMGRRAGSPAIDMSGCLLLPGLINAHDHLEFNLFPRLGEGPYRNFREWSEAIYRPQASPVREHSAVPKTARLWWGAIKNLLAGVTTVCHHNPYAAGLFGDFPVRVVKTYGWAHSLALGGDVAAAYRQTPADAPFMIHLGEGTDEASESEVFELDRLGALGPNTVIVHGVGLSERGRRLVRERGAALVWCPSSNLFTLGKTLTNDTVLTCPRLALGTDSALSGAGDLLDELRIAAAQGVAPHRLYEIVTTAAADVLRLRDGEGKIAEGAAADLLVVRDRGLSPAETLSSLGLRDIEAVLVGGCPRLVSRDMQARWRAPLPGLQEVSVGEVRRLADAPVAALLEAARAHLGADVLLAGKRVSA